MKLRVSDILAVADQRPLGYVEVIMGASRPAGEGWVEVDEADLAAIKTRFGVATEGPQVGCGGCGGCGG